MAEILSNSLWLVILLLVVAAHLIRDFVENKFCELALLFRIIEADELDDITLSPLTLAVLKGRQVAVELCHSIKISVTHSDDDDRASLG